MIFFKIIDGPTTKKHDKTLDFIKQLNNATYLR